MNAATRVRQNGGTMNAAARLRQIAWRHPEWWVAFVCCQAWFLILARPSSLMINDNAMVTAMIVAMMLPLTIPTLRHVAFASLWNRRHRAMALFAVAYLAVWFAAELGIVLILVFLEHSTDPAATRVGVVAVAVAWETSRRKTLMIRRCGQTVPLAPRGWRADADCMRFGFLIGTNCVGSCWALMATCTALAHYPLVMVTAFFVQMRAFTDGRPGPILLGSYDKARALLLSS